MTAHSHALTRARPLWQPRCGGVLNAMRSVCVCQLSSYTVKLGQALLPCLTWLLLLSFAFFLFDPLHLRHDLTLVDTPPDDPGSRGQGFRFRALLMVRTTYCHSSTRCSWTKQKYCCYLFYCECVCVCFPFPGISQ